MKKNGTYSAEELSAIANKLLEDRDVTYGDEFGTFISPEKYAKLDAEAKKAFKEYTKEAPAPDGELAEPKKTKKTKPE
jgi:hypothetical protein